MLSSDVDVNHEGRGRQDDMTLAYPNGRSEMTGSAGSCGGMARHNVGIERRVREDGRRIGAPLEGMRDPIPAISGLRHDLGISRRAPQGASHGPPWGVPQAKKRWTVSRGYFVH